MKLINVKKTKNDIIENTYNDGLFGIDLQYQAILLCNV